MPEPNATQLLPQFYIADKTSEDQYSTPAGLILRIIKDLEWIRRKCRSGS